jgi:hypothetical protein
MNSEFKRIRLEAVVAEFKVLLHIPHRRYPYFDVVVGLARSEDPENYAGGSVATGRVSLAEQVKGDDPD